jgi:DNA-binding NarL/FixJ family response regulator
VRSAPGLPHQSATQAAELTSREREVLEFVAQGLSDGQIARRLGVASATVSKHLQRIYRRHGVANRAAAIALINTSPGD